MRLLKPLLLALLLVSWLLAPVAGSRVNIDFARFQQQMEVRFGASRVPVARAWEQLLKELQHAPVEVQLERVNLFVNQNVRYRRDHQLWGVEDYWATPLETFGKGGGDCEDYTIAKYVSLRHLGFSDDQLRLIYVNLRVGGARSSITEAHMVLGYYATPNAEPLILDNTITAIMPASQRPDLSPVFSFNSEGLWAGGQQTRQSPTARLSRWRGVLERLQNEGVSW